MSRYTIDTSIRSMRYMESLRTFMTEYVHYASRDEIWYHKSTIKTR